MLFESYLMPDLMFDTFRDVTPEFLLSGGISVLICDIDNTLATYEQPDPPEDVAAWVRAMKAAGISIAFVSNNGPSRIERFNRELDCAAYANAKKPSPKIILNAVRDCGGTPESAAFLGDQLLTDVCAAKRAGMRAYLVPPIKDKTSLFFKAKRAIEKPYIKKYRRRHGE